MEQRTEDQAPATSDDFGCVVGETPDLVVTAFGDGLAYAIACRLDEREVMRTGADAFTFRRDLAFAGRGASLPGTPHAGRAWDGVQAEIVRAYRSGWLHARLFGPARTDK